MSFHNEEEDVANNDTAMLLNLSHKSGIFVADQTPTPTRLIKNCEEVGLFEDLQNVNPFDETFRRACELNVQNTLSCNQQFHTDENSLHTPQVFPQFDTAVEGGILAIEDLTKQTLDSPVVLDIGSSENILDVTQPCITPKNSKAHPTTKYRPIARKPVTNNGQQPKDGITFSPSSLQFIQPQFITVTFPNTSTDCINNNDAQRQQQKQQTYDDFNNKTKHMILPKLSPIRNSIASTTYDCSLTTSTQLTTHNEPSSASLTPTSQLPIKERLKAILNQSSKTRPADWFDKFCSSKINNKKTNKSNGYKSSKDDSTERRRAASSRYRHKMRNEYKELRKRSADLQIENEKLKEKIKQLETENSKLKLAALQPALASTTLPSLGVPVQIQIPASTIHLVMNIPKLEVPRGSSDLNTPGMLKNS